MTTATLPDLLTRVQAADFLNLRRQTLAAWACRGFGPKFIKLGKAVRYRRSELERFLSSNEFSNTAEVEHA